MTRRLRIAGWSLAALFVVIGAWTMVQHSVSQGAGEEWSLIASTNDPGTRHGHTLTFDVFNHQLLLFGGDAGTGSYQNDLWAFPLPGGPWTLLTPAGTPPPVRTGQSAVWDDSRRELLVFGGHCGAGCNLNDVWSYDALFNTWTQLANNGTPPFAGADYSTIYDPVNDQMLVFGGFQETPGVYHNETWSYDRTSETWAQLTPTGGPPPGRAGAAGDYDTLASRMLVFGGQTSSSTYTNDLWSYDPTANTWTQLTPTGGPPSARGYTAHGWDPDSFEQIVFGGRDARSAMSDTWGYTSGADTWTQLATTGAVPAARSEGAAAWATCTVDPFFMYGGTSPAMQDYWEFSLTPCVATPTPTNTAPATNTATPTRTPTATNTATPTPSPTATNTPSPTNTPNATQTFNAQGSLTPMATNTSTPTPTATRTNTPTSTNTATATNTRTATVTNTPVPAITSTPTNTATNTPTKTSTATSTPGAQGSVTPVSTATPPHVVKVPEGNGNNRDLSVPAANLWLCIVGPCAGPGEGHLLVTEHASNVHTGDQNGDTIEDGLGAYEFSVEYDNFVIQSVNPCDVVFSPGGTGAARGNVTQLASSAGCATNPTPINGQCTQSLILENVIHFGCVTLGQVAGPTGEFDIARLNLIPHPDLRNDIFPGNQNGVLTIIKDNGCELVDVFGHAVTGSVNGGLTPVCGDLAVTVRILEGDLNLDCSVNVQDEQLIAFRYGSFFGSALYNKWFDLEPALHDLDIDIKDLQKVFGRDGSTCQAPVPSQPPLPPPVPFVD